LADQLPGGWADRGGREPPGRGPIIGTQAVATSPPTAALLIGGLANMVFNAGLYKSAI
jgi:hypothetical protein